MPCKVCLSPSAGIHYQSLCCRACAAFFRRTVNKKIRYKCGRGGNCDVTYKNRFTCRFCRMKRCVAVGMVMNDEPSTSFDFHFDEDSDTIEGDSVEENDEFYSADNIFGNNEVFIEEFRAKIFSILNKKYKKPDLPFCLSLCQQIAIANANHKKKWPDCRKERLHGGVIDMSRLMCTFFQEMQFTAEFCMEIRSFVELPLDQRNAVFKHFAARYSQMERIFVSVDILGRNVDDKRLVSVDGQIVDFFNCKMQLDNNITTHTETELKSVLLSTEKQVNDMFIQPYKRFEADPFEISFLIAFAMWTLDDAEDISAETLGKSKSIRDRLSEELHFYYYYEKEWTNYAKRIYRIHNLLIDLNKIVELRKQDGSMAKTFQLFKVNILMTAINEFT